MQKIKNVSVIGAGIMGQQIALNAALCHFDVVLNDSNKEALDKAKTWANEYLASRISKGKLTEEQVNTAKSKLSFEADLTNTVKNADLVIEVIIENLDIKQNLFKQIDKLAPKHALLVSNSSRIASSEIAQVVDRKDKVANFHYFNPALVMELIEVVKGPHTSDETIEALMQFARDNKKTPILLKKEIDGFVVNRVLGGIMDEALNLLELGIATPEEIDLGLMKGLNHPIGPFKLMDLTGIDLAYAIRKRRTDKSDPSYDPNYKIPRVLQEKIERGELGRKTGKGWYSY